MLTGLKAFGEDISQLISSRYTDKLEMTQLDSLMGKMLANINMLSTLPTTDNVVTPFDASSAVFENQRVGILGCGEVRESKLSQ